jgi:hypothetical protein
MAQEPSEGNKDKDTGRNEPLYTELGKEYYRIKLWQGTVISWMEKLWG